MIWVSLSLDIIILRPFYPRIAVFWDPLLISVSFTLPQIVINSFYDASCNSKYITNRLVRVIVLLKIIVFFGCFVLCCCLGIAQVDQA